MGAVTGKTWLDHSEPRIMAADLEAIEAGIVDAADATADLAASTIVGVGRPDIPATLTTSGTAALVAAATSGTVFRSTDGPQGAWEWQKRGSSWVCMAGDTDWVDIGHRLSADWVADPAVPFVKVRRVDGSVTFALRLLVAPAASFIGASRLLHCHIFASGLPGTWRGASYTPLGPALIGTTAPAAFAAMSDVARPGIAGGTGTWGAGDAVILQGKVVAADPGWPTTLNI